MNPEEEKQLEYMEVEEVDTEKPLILSLNRRKLFSSFPVQSASSTSFPAKTSSIALRCTLRRSSRSDITNVHSNEKDVFEVSKSFGQFTFGQNQSIDSEESLYAKKLEILSQDSAQKENHDIKPEIEKAKRRLRPLMQEKKTEQIYSYSYWKIIFFLLLPVTVILISTILNQQRIGSSLCVPILNFTNITENLPKLVHGQTQGVADIVELFQTKGLQFKIIALIGGTGVGKSHVANIIKNSSPQNYYAFEYFPPLHSKVRQVYSLLSTCQCNIVILENLRAEDITDAAFFSHALRNRASDLCVVILALFNIQVTDDNLMRKLDSKGSVERIKNGFKRVGVEVKTVNFEPLGEESLMKCIMKAVRESRLKLTEEDITRVRKSLLRANTGCKGAYSKVQLLGKVP